MLIKLTKSIYHQDTRSNRYYDIIENLSELQIQLSLLEITLLDEQDQNLSIMNTVIRPISSIINLRSSGLYNFFIDDTIRLWVINSIIWIYLIIPLLISLCLMIKMKYDIVPDLAYKWIPYFGYIHLYVTAYIIHGFLAFQIKKSIFGNIINSILLGFSLILIIINIITWIFICKVCISQIYLPGFISHKFKYNRWINLIFKLIFPIFQVLGSSLIRNTIFWIFLIIWGIIRQLNLVLMNPYYNYNTAKIMSCMQGITSGIIISNLIIFLIQLKFENCSNICVMILFFICSFSSKCFMIIIDNKINELLYKKKKLTDIDYVSQYLLIEQFMDNYHKKEDYMKNIIENEIKSNGLLLSHKLRCNKCLNEESFQHIRQHLLETKIFEGLDIYKNSLSLNCLAINYHFNQKYNAFHSCFLLEKLKTKNLCIEDKIILKTYETRIEEILYITNNDKNLEYGKFVNSDNFFEKFLSIIKNATENYLKFWSEVNSPIPNLLNLIKFGIQIRKDDKKIKKTMTLYETKIMDDFTKPLLIAGLYYDILKNNHEKSFFLIQKYQKIHIYNINPNIITNEIFYSKDNVNIRISGEDDSIGTILSCSGNITQITNLNSRKLIGQNISQILPNFYGAYHNDFIRDYKKNGIGNIINRTTDRFCKHESGHLIPVKANISIYPILDCGLMFIGFIRIMKTNNEFILINEDGQIKGMTLGISKDLNFQADSKIDFLSLLYLNRKGYNKATDLDPNSFKICNSKTLKEYQHENDDPMHLIEQKTMISTQDRLWFKFSSRISQTSKFVFQNFLEDYFKYDSQNEKKLIFKKIQTNNSNNNNNQDVTNDNMIQYDYFEYMASLEKNCYKFGLHIYKLRLRKCENKSTFRYPDLKLQEKTIISEDDISLKESISKSNFLSVNKPFMKKPEFLRELLDDDSSTKKEFSVKKKVKYLIKSQTRSKISLLSENSILPKNHNLTERNSNSPGKNINKKDSISFQSNFQQENTIREEIIFSHDENYIDSNINESYSFQSEYFNKKSKTKSQIHKAEKKSSKQFFKFRSIFLEMNILLMIILFLFSIVGISIMYSTSITNISNIDRDLMISYHCNQRLANLVEVDKRLRTIWLIKANLMSDTRHAWRNIVSYYTNSITRTIEVSQYLIGNNSLILNEIQYIDDVYQNDFYSKLVKLFNVDKTGEILTSYTEVNSFIAGYHISQVFNKIKKLAISQMTINNTDLLFILRNGLNDIYIVYENSSHILADEISSLIYTIQQSSLIILLFIFIIAILSMLFLIAGLNALFYKKKSLLMHLIKLNIQYCQLHINRINQFLKGLQENYSDAEFINFYNDNKDYQSEHESKNNNRVNKKSKRNIKKMVNTFGIKLDLAKYFLIFLTILIIFIAIFILEKVIVDRYMQNINTAIQRILFSSEMLAQQSFAIALIYEYIGENGTTIVRNNPIDLTISQIMPIIGDLQGFLTNFRDQKGDLDPNLQFIMNSNACTIVPPDYIKDCLTLGGAPGLNGISSINSYVYKALNTALNEFQNSKRTTQDANNTLWLWYLRDLEAIFPRVTMPAYSYLYNQLLDELGNQINSYQAFNLAWSIMSFFSVLILEIIVWILTNHKLMNEIMSMNHIMKIIPRSIIEKSRFYIDRRNSIFESS